MQRGRGAGVLNESAEARRPGKSFGGGKLGKQSAGADGRRNLTAADPKIKESDPKIRNISVGGELGGE